MVPQLVVTVYFIVTVPAATPATCPAPLTVAIEAALVLQAPPVILLLKLIEAFTHTALGPLMVPASARELTVMEADWLAVPQGVVTV